MPENRLGRGPIKAYSWIWGRVGAGDQAIGEEK